MSSENDVNVVVAIDFGTTFSGFAFANKVKPEEINISNIHLNNIWLGRKGLPKTNTALLYIDEYLELNRRWGEQALIYEPSRRVEQVHYIIERFKLLLDNDAKDNWPVLPKSLDAKTVITDYFVKMKEVIEEVLEKRCRVSLSQVLFVLSVPAEWPPHTRDILRDCVYKAGLLDESKRQSNNYRLEFTTEPEAAAIYCLSYAGEDFSPGDTYLVVDCGGGTVDLTIRTLLPDKTLEEETNRIDDDKIINPPDPIAAIVKGACYYGLNKNIVKIRILKWSYGIETNSEYNQYDDPKELRFDGNRILRFNVLANQGDKLEVNKDGKPREYKPLSRNQLAVTFKLLYANFPNPKYPSQKGVKTLGKLTINLPLKGYGTDRIIEFFLRFAEEELKVTARNKITLESYSATFNYPRDGDNPV
ncbi:unnamed protein product [Rhizophagus irregularis]|uniref:Actin-like ATPase domain-containing protein n=1 Tax=Rhizophagus irregularis TaxID=588596 RepID=A0A915ZNZ6_9GLOM|nr:unnamed protein product [Rhizophagus irregularis]